MSFSEDLETRSFAPVDILLVHKSESGKNHIKYIDNERVSMKLLGFGYNVFAILLVRKSSSKRDAKLLIVPNAPDYLSFILKKGYSFQSCWIKYLESEGFTNLEKHKFEISDRTSFSKILLFEEINQ